MRAPIITSGYKKIALIDDKRDDILIDGIVLNRAGFETVYIEGPFSTVEELVNTVRSKAQVAVCDHYLQPGGYASFHGADTMERFYDEKFPALLTTQFYNSDCDVSIRKGRRWMPRILSKHEFTPAAISECVQACLNEYDGKFEPSRKPCRTLVRILRMGSEDGDLVVDALVPSWDSNETVRFPKSLIPDSIRDQAQVGTRLIAEVNTGAERQDELYFNNFEIAAEPFTEDDLAKLYDT